MTMSSCVFKLFIYFFPLFSRLIATSGAVLVAYNFHLFILIRAVHIAHTQVILQATDYAINGVFIFMKKKEIVLKGMKINKMKQDMRI